MIEDQIQKMGGKIVPDIHRGVAAVISKDTKSDELQYALMSRFPIVSDDFLDEVMTYEPINVIKKRDMTEKGKSVRKLFIFLYL